MNKSLVLTALIGSLLLAGCNGGSEKSGEDIQKKIDEAGWKIVVSKGGTKSENTSLEISSEEVFLVFHDKENDEISSITFSSKLTDSELDVFRNSGSSDDIGNISNDGILTCSLYNITKEEESSEISNNSKGCKEQDVNKLKDLIKVRDKTLKDYDLTVDDLFIWGKWSYDKK